MIVVWIASAAFAGDVVLFDGMDADQAVRQVQSDGGTSATASGLATLLLGHPIVASPGPAEGCAGPAVVPAALDEAARRARSKLDYIDPDGAIAEVEAALRGVPCLSGPADTEAVARLFFLKGVAHHAAGRSKEATAAFAQARVVAPGMGWDPAFPPDAKPLFDDAPSGRPVRLEVYPPRGDRVVVDGRGGLVPGELMTGTHLVQAVGDATTGAWVPLEADTFVLLPSLVLDRDVRGIGDPALAAPLARAIAVALPTPTDVYVALPKGTWRITSGDTEFSVVARHNPTLRRVVGPVTLATGAAALIGGGALYGVSYGQGHRAWESGDASTGATHAEYEAALPAYNEAKERMGLGAGVAGAGALVAGIGLSISLGGPR